MNNSSLITNKQQQHSHQHQQQQHSHQQQQHLHQQQQHQEEKDKQNSMLGYGNTDASSNQNKISSINSTLSPLLNQLSLQVNNGINQHVSLSPREIIPGQTFNPYQTYVRIVEQPARCALRFRYECEGRSAGSIPGCNSTSDNKTFPTIEIVNYKGPAVVVVSCVTKQHPHRPHPHNLVGKEGCKKGICTLLISNSQMKCTFTSLGIQCVKKKDIEESLRLRESIKVDPFRTGFSHKSHVTTMDLNVVRLCFQVFIEGNEKEKFSVPLIPVVSDPIYDKKAMSDLIITRLSHCSAPICGGKEVILLCDRITKDDIQVRFYEEQNKQIVWESLAEFQPSDIHKQVAICFKVPKYYLDYISSPVTVFVQLRRPGDGHVSEPRKFQYIPNTSESCSVIVRKRQKYEELNSLEISANENLLKKRNFEFKTPHVQQQQQQQQMEFRVPRFSLNYINEEDQLNQNILNTSNLQQSNPASNYYMYPENSCSPVMAQNSPKQIKYESNVTSSLEPSQLNLISINQNNTTSVIKNHHSQSEQATFGQLQSQYEPEVRNRYHFGQVKEEPINNNNLNNPKAESLELDIDANDLMSDINFNNMMVMMDSGNNIAFNSSGNIKMEVSNNNCINQHNDNYQINSNHLLDISNNQLN